MIPEVHPTVRPPLRALVFRVGLLAGLLAGRAALGADPLPGTGAWTGDADPAAAMVAGIDRFLDRESVRLAGERLGRARAEFGNPDQAAAARAALAAVLGVVDARSPGRLEVTEAAGLPAGDRVAGQVGMAGGIRVVAVHWPVFREVRGEGLLLVPPGTPSGDVISIPDCDVTPEQWVGLEPGVEPSALSPMALAAAGFRVLVPGLVDRGTRWAGNPPVRTLRQGQRETLWRAGYQVGRHLLGYEVQQVLAAADALRTGAPDRPLGLTGRGEGGLVALYAGALDDRFSAVAVDGAFGLSAASAGLPLYRDVWSVMTRWGDAELAALIAPRPLLIGYGGYPSVVHTDAHGGAPGRLAPPAREDFDAEVARWRSIAPGAPGEVVVDGSADAFLTALGGRRPTGVLPAPPTATAPADPGALAVARAERLYRQILADTQDRMRESEYTRKEFWKQADTGSADAFVRTSAPYRDHFRQHVVGVLPPASLPPAPRSRLLWHTNGIRGFEVRLEVHPDVFATGILAVPDGIRPGERRPVVVCQHGLEGRPRDVADPFTDHPAYHRYAFRLAEAGFVTFSPQNPYIGHTTFRQVLRKAQPLGLTLWSFIVRQHEVITDWLAAQDFVDPARIAFYGLSYGGKTAMRVPALVDRYCLSICSADYNEWIWKNTSARSPYSYLWTVEYDMPEWNLANTFNYAEMSWLVFPRPFMVERGHDDGVAPDEWVAYEYARTRRHYVKLGLGDRTEIEFFDGPHTIHGVGTFAFLRRHLHWPPPPQP